MQDFSAEFHNLPYAPSVTSAQITPAPISVQNAFSVTAKGARGNLYAFEIVTGSAAGYIVQQHHDRTDYG